MSFSRSAWLKGLEEDDESDDEILDEEVHDRPDAIMYLVEVSPSMHEAVQVEEDQPDGTTSTRYISNLSTSLKSCLDLMKARIISGSSRDVIGFLLYNTVNTKYIEGELPKTGLYLLLEPQTIRAHNIKMISDLVEEAETDPKAFQKRFQPIDTDVKPSHIVDGMKMSESLLRYRSSNLSNRSLFLITDNDDPLQGNKQQQSVALVFANDAHESGFQIKTFFMPADGSHFDLSLFWNRFRFDPSLDVEMDNASLVFSGPERFDKLLSLSSESGKTKRAQFTIPFYLFEGIALSITGYATISEQKKKLPVTIEQAEEIKQVYFKTLYTQIDTGEVLKDPKKEIVKYMRIGEKDQNEQRIFFEDDEIARIKTLGMTPCMCFTGYGDIRHSVLMPLTASALKLLGFAPKSQLKPEYTIKHAYQIYPNETQFANSIPAFSALLKSMLKKDIIGLGVLIPRTNSTPQIVYLLPQAEVRDEETDVQIDPPCIWVIQAPYADDIRYPTVEECQSAVDVEGDENPLVDNFKKLIKKMRVQYSPHQFPNPVLQYHYNILAALALQEDTPSPDDTTLPDVQAIVSRAGPMIKSINETLNDDERYTNIKWRRSTTANVIDRTTRSATAGAGGNDDDNEEEDRKPKKIKVSNEKASISINELEKTLVKAFNGGEKGLKKITNDILKDYLKQKSQKISGSRKAELLALTRDQLVKDGKMEADD